MNKSCVSDWTGMTVRDYLGMREIDGLQMASEEEKNLRVAAMLARIDFKDFETLPLSEVRGYMDNTAFLFEKPVPAKARRTYEVNGRRYRLFRDPSEMTVAQFIDFQMVQAEGFDRMPAEMLSIFLVPEGHEYNDGYDRETQTEDMLDLGITEALGVCDFFTRRLSRLIRLVAVALRLRMGWMALTARKEDREMLRAARIQLRLILEEISRMSGLTR